MAGKYKIFCDQGATLRRVFVVATAGPPPEAWPLAGYAARMQLRATAESDVVLELTTGNGRLAIGTGPGELLLDLSAEDTASLVAGVYVYDLELQSPSGVVTRLLQGAVVVNRNVTR